MAFPPPIASLIALPLASPAGSPIDGTVVAAVLAAAALHALWNAIAHATDDQLIGFALIGAGHTACGAVIVAAAGLPPRRAWIFVGTSVCLHIVYTLLLLASYRLGEFSQMYPVARGTSPWAVALVATTVLGQRLPPLQLTGVLVISGGLISLAALGHRTAPAGVPGATPDAAPGPREARVRTSGLPGAPGAAAGPGRARSGPEPAPDGPAGADALAGLGTPAVPEPARDALAGLGTPAVSEPAPDAVARPDGPAGQRTARKAAPGPEGARDAVAGPRRGAGAVRAARALVPARRPALRAARKAPAAAFGTGLVIACYTIVDGVGVHHAPVAAYAGWIFLLQGPAIPLLAAARYGRTLPARLRGPAATGVTGGVLSVVAYGLVLWAQARGTLAPIAALRETSIVIGAVIGAVFLGERFGLRRAVAAAIVVTGIVLINVR